MSRARFHCIALFVAWIAAITSGCSTSSASKPPLSVTVSPAAPQAIDQGQTLALTAVVANDASGGGVAWTLAGPGSLSVPTTSSVTYKSPTTNLTKAQQVTVTAASIADPTKTASVRITVNLYPQLPFQKLVNGSVAAPYSQTIALTGGTPPFQWSVYNGPIITGNSVGGSVPDGLTLNAKTGVISGTPTAGGTWFFDATVTDATGVTAENGFMSIQVNPTAPPGNPVSFLNQPLVPASVAPGSSGVTLNVTGAGFVPGAIVDFNNAPLPTTFVDSEHLSAILAAADVANPGTAAVTIVNPSPGGGRSNPVCFQVGTPEAAVTFVNATNSPLQIVGSAGPFGLAVADFNEDWKPDLVATENWKVYAFLGKGDGTFAPASGSPIAVPSPPYDDFASPYTGAISVGDFNHSGHLGLAVGEFQNAAAIIFLGHGDGTFVTSSAVFANALGTPISAMGPADFNADGNLDLAIANEISGQSPVVLGYGKGAFNAAGDLYSAGFTLGIVVGDFNGDGKLDVAAAGAGTSKYPDSGVAVSLGKGDGTFTKATGSPISLGQSLSAIVAADFNGDGKLDLAVTDSVANTVIVLLGNGDGTFGGPTVIPVGNGPGAMVAGDFNNDGKLDLAVANFSDGTVTLLLGNGDGTLTPASSWPTGKGPYALAAADFNGDGKLDLAVANMSDSSVSILLQQ